MSALLLREVRPVPLGPGSRPAPEPVDLLVRDGVVAEVGEGLAGPGVETLEADGRWVVPGLWDQHVHMVQWARVLGWLDLTGTISSADVLARVAEQLRASSEPVIIGFGYRSAAWDVQPTVVELDAVSGARPIVLISGDGHNGWLSSAAQDLLGVAPRDSALDETEWFPVWARLADLPRDEKADEAAYREAVQRAAAVGVVGITDMEFGRGYADWPERVSRGVRSIRARPATYPETLDDVIGLGLRTGDPLAGGEGLVTMGPLKVISDGSLNTRTAYCCEPYLDDPTCRGKLNVPPDELRTLLTRAHEHGLEVAVHAIGDAAVASALDAFAHSGDRGRIEHAQLITRADVTRMGGLPVTASVQPAHLLDDRDVTATCWGDRADRCFPLRSLLDAGVPLALGSDAPVSPLDPWLAMAAAVHRSGDEREPWNPAEALTPAEALAASTGGAGTVGQGSRADLVLLECDPLAPADGSAAAARTLREMRVALTLLDGRVTHDAR